MGTRKLYKGRYLIALYDSDDRLVDVGLNSFELLTCKANPRSIYQNVSSGRESIFGYTIHLIDCLEEHDDVFKEEDELFLKDIEGLTKEFGVEEQMKAVAKKYGISKRTAYRWKAQGKLKGF